MATRGRCGARLAGLSLVLLAGVTSGCGSGSDPSPPAGVDGLTIPTPTIDPDDFVTGIDNPWLPLPVGAAWEYDVTGDQPGTATVTTLEGPDVESVATTAVRTVLIPDRGDRSAATDFYAQDRRGNVWWLGREGVWLAGEGGAEAGLVMAARPRVGDGYRQALAPDVVDLRARVLMLSDDRVTLEITSPLAGSTLQVTYADGVGLVLLDTVEGEPEMQLGLVGYDEP